MSYMTQEKEDRPMPYWSIIAEHGGGIAPSSPSSPSAHILLNRTSLHVRGPQVGFVSVRLLYHGARTASYRRLSILCFRNCA